MKLSLDWISDYVELKDIDLDWLISKFTITTAEIEGVIQLENDVIIEIDNKSITNRPDLWCHYGIAREIAVITGRALKNIECVDIEQLMNDNEIELDIEVEDRTKCLRYSAIKIDKIRANSTSETIAKRLTSCGIQSINTIVDLANYVMLDIGQPLHTFDSNVVDGIRVTSLMKSEKFMTLDKVEREIPEGTLMICSKSRSLAVAGIMGGDESAVSEYTESIILESANFDGVAIRKTASALGLRTDASVRYEKFLDSEITILAIGRFLKLLQQYQPVVKIASSLYDNILNVVKPVNISLQHKYIETYLGNSIDRNTVINILNALQFSVEEAKGIYNVKVPTFRATKDITGKADIIEEILRVYGYDKISGIPNKLVSAGTSKNTMKDMEYLIKDILVQKFAFCEVHSYCWYDNDWLKKLNYEYNDTLKIVNSDMKQFEKLRSDISPNLLQIIYNNRKTYEEIKIFEVGRSFVMKEGILTQDKHLTAIIYSNKEVVSSNSYVKGICSYILKIVKNIKASYVCVEETYKENCLAVYYKEQKLGYIYSVPSSTQRICGGKSIINIIDINLELLNAVDRKEIKYKNIPKYPETYLDFSILTADNMPYHDIEAMVKEFKHELIIQRCYIGTYSGENVPDKMKSTTIRIVIGDANRTLQLEEINDVKELFMKHLEINELQLR
jgi:phenylalanyl-tRNA synthetase beta chain